LITHEGPESPVEPPRPRLLLVEDDPELAPLLARLLFEKGYLVDVAHDGQRGLHLGLSGRYDVLVVDRGLPALEGVDLVRRLRRAGISAPVLILSAWGTVDDRVEGLDAGAEDYLLKPFEMAELLARLRALQRRNLALAESLRLGTRTLVVTERLVVGERRADVELSARECDLLQLLARSPGRVFGRAELLRQVFRDSDTAGLIDTYVYYLRRKLGRDVIKTVRGRGYRMGSA
jgi:two-component system, OmpR family, response regulator QseB